MPEIISPLDKILTIVAEIKSANASQRRGSNFVDAYDKIVSNVNEAENNIIMQILKFALLSWDKLKNKLFTKPFPA